MLEWTFGKIKRMSRNAISIMSDPIRVKASRRQRAQILFVLMAAVSLPSCGGNVNYAVMGSTFDACKVECDRELSWFKVPVFCLGLNNNAAVQYDAVLREVNEFADTAGNETIGCGCARAVITTNGRLSDLEIVYSNRTDADELFSRAVEGAQVVRPFESCLVGSVVPILFGSGAEPGIALANRLHTVYPIRKFIADASLSEVSQINATDELAWVSLNTRFGIIALDQMYYLAEAEDYCLPIKVPRDYAVDDEQEGERVSATQLLIDGCRLQTLYSIDARQAYELESISLGES